MDDIEWELGTAMWSNGACKGYVLLACRKLGYDSGATKELLVQLDRCFDAVTVERAVAVYEDS